MSFNRPNFYVHPIHWDRQVEYALIKHGTVAALIFPHPIMLKAAQKVQQLRSQSFVSANLHLAERSGTCPMCGDIIWGDICVECSRHHTFSCPASKKKHSSPFDESCTCTARESYAYLTEYHG